MMARFRKIRKPVILGFIVVLVICLLPIPIKVEREMQGFILNNQGECTPSIVEVEGFYFWSVLLSNYYCGGIKFSNTPLDSGRRYWWIPFRKTSSPLVHRASLWSFYVPGRDLPPTGLMYVDGLFSEIRVEDFPDTFYIYPANNEEEAKRVAERVLDKASGR